ncbi:MAG: cupin domain-containing protein [Thermomicrobiales bacterium]
MKYIRVYVDENGESHFEDVEVELNATDFAPPAPPLQLSPMTPASGVAFVRFPPGWNGGWHPTPRRQFFFFLSGEIACETSDGDHRSLSLGSAVFLEDTTGRGHRAWVMGDGEVLATVVQLAD